MNLRSYQPSTVNGVSSPRPTDQMLPLTTASTSKFRTGHGKGNARSILMGRPNKNLRGIFSSRVEWEPVPRSFVLPHQPKSVSSETFSAAFSNNSVKGTRGRGTVRTSPESLHINRPLLGCSGNSAPPVSGVGGLKRDPGPESLWTRAGSAR